MGARGGSNEPIAVQLSTAARDKEDDLSQPALTYSPCTCPHQDISPQFPFPTYIPSPQPHLSSPHHHVSSSRPRHSLSYWSQLEIPQHNRKEKIVSPVVPELITLQGSQESRPPEAELVPLIFPCPAPQILQCWSVTPRVIQLLWHMTTATPFPHPLQYIAYLEDCYGNRLPVATGYHYIPACVSAGMIRA
ncbi:hypothetical protein INR49_001908 [Caranx melampygus]|nr:hypothetical protein INR49_001908 [Caranx melampygus]